MYIHTAIHVYIYTHICSNNSNNYNNRSDNNNNNNNEYEQLVMYRVYAYIPQRKFPSPFLSCHVFLSSFPLFSIFSLLLSFFSFLSFFLSFFSRHNTESSTGLLIRQRSSDPATDRRRDLSRYYLFFFFFELLLLLRFFFFFLLLITCNMRNRILFVKDIPYTTRLR